MDDPLKSECFLSYVQVYYLDLFESFYLQDLKLQHSLWSLSILPQAIESSLLLYWHLLSFTMCLKMVLFQWTFWKEYNQVPKYPMDDLTLLHQSFQEKGNLKYPRMCLSSKWLVHLKNLILVFNFRQFLLNLLF